jgi:hypothetical protein
MSILCTVPKRRSFETELFVVATGSSQRFELSTGASLEDTLTSEIENIAGVGSVEINQVGDSCQVNVTMETYDFSSYEKVIEKEMQLFDQNHGSKFVFNVTFAERPVSGSSASNAA